MPLHAQDVEFIASHGAADGKPVAFVALKADEPREAKQDIATPCTRIGRGHSGRTDPHG